MKLLNSRVIRISIASVLTGILIGLVGGAFRYCLIAADTQRDALVAWAHAWPYVGWLAPVALGLVGAALARFLVVRFAPIAEGSGVTRVEAAFSGEVKLAPYPIVPVKFFGGGHALCGFGRRLDHAIDVGQRTRLHGAAGQPDVIGQVAGGGDLIRRDVAESRKHPHHLPYSP